MNLQVTFQGFYFSHFSVEVFHNFLHGKLTKFALIINKFNVSSLSLMFTNFDKGTSSLLIAYRDEAPAMYEILKTHHYI